MINKHILRLLSVSLSVILISTVAFTSTFTAATSNDVDKLQQELNDIKNNINNIKDESEKSEKHKKSLSQQNTIVKQQITGLSSSVTSAKDALADKQSDLDAKKQAIAETDVLFQERLRAMYVMQNSGILSTILGANSFEEMLSASTTLSRISISDTELLERLATEKAQIEADELYIQDAVKSLEGQVVQMENKKVELANNLKAEDENLSQLDAEKKAEEVEYDVIYKQYIAALKEVENDFGQGSSGEFVGGEFLWPVPGFFHISSGYGNRTLYGRPDFHTGIDIAKGNQPTISGAPVVASLDGTVQITKYGSTGYGYYVMLDHGGNTKTLYGHLSGIAVSPGQTVTKGQTIGYVGSTGNSTGPHLHFEIRLNGQKVDPVGYLKG